MRSGDDDELGVWVGEGLIDVCITSDASSALGDGLARSPGSRATTPWSLNPC